MQKEMTELDSRPRRGLALMAGLATNVTVSTQSTGAEVSA